MPNINNYILAHSVERIGTDHIFFFFKDDLRKVSPTLLLPMWRQTQRKQSLPTLLDPGDEVLFEAFRLRKRGGRMAAGGGIRCRVR